MFRAVVSSVLVGYRPLFHHVVRRGPLLTGSLDDVWFTTSPKGDSLMRNVDPGESWCSFLSGVRLCAWMFLGAPHRRILQYLVLKNIVRLTYQLTVFHSVEKDFNFLNNGTADAQSRWEISHRTGWWIVINAAIQSEMGWSPWKGTIWKGNEIAVDRLPYSLRMWFSEIGPHELNRKWTAEKLSSILWVGHLEGVPIEYWMERQQICCYIRWRSGYPRWVHRN